VSFTIGCNDQDEVDYYWDSLTDGGEESQCGWCKDRFGLSWQIVPDRLYELVSHRVRKIVIADLEDAAAAV
jgi:predicted 3-demethylubiquinone-9 3-methyltransferase (glyoxalase superfamily)